LSTRPNVDQLAGFPSLLFTPDGNRRPNRRRMLALLQPRASAGFGVVRSVGRRMSVMPSKSTGVHW